MCGIAGLISFNKDLPKDEMKSMVERMADTMDHRGPDDSGVWIDPSGYCALSHRRLSIIDISAAGHQPMESVDHRYCITYNGEIYNFKELRPEIEASGCTFRSQSDTEVLIEAMRLWGTETFLKLDGMYSFGFFDKHKREILLARDPFGEKPLYYFSTSKYFAFASELNALHQLPFFDNAIGIEGIAEYLCFQYIGAPRTLYSNIRKLPPGHYLKLDPDGNYSIHRYFEFRPGEGELTIKPIDELADELEDILVRSIKRRMISDVPLGAFLSGGVDSSTVVALIRKVLNMPIKTFSIGFAGTNETEHTAARQFAEHLETEHREKILSPDASQFLFNVGKLIDEPNGDSSCLPTYLLSEFARQEVTVAISGDGGDEMFGGYDRYFATLEEESNARNMTLKEWDPGKAYYSSRILAFPEEHIKELLGYIPSGLRNILEDLQRIINSGSQVSLLDKMRKADTDNYMPGAVLAKVDRMSMRHSLEVRTPFLNIEIARFAEKLPFESLYHRGAGKLILKRIAARYLPVKLINTPKRGFGLPTMSRWGDKDLLNTASNLLESDESKLSAVVGTDGIKRFMARQRSEHGFSAYQVWAMSVLESYLRYRPASLPDIASGLSVESCVSEQPGNFELSMLLCQLQQSSTIIFLCEDVIPSYSNELKDKCIIVSMLPIKTSENLKLYHLNWKDEELSWIDALESEVLKGGTVWFYTQDCNIFSHRSISLIMAMKGKGIREVVFNRADGNCTKFAIQKLISKELINLVAQEGHPLKGPFIQRLTKKDIESILKKVYDKYPVLYRLGWSLLRVFSRKLGSDHQPILHENSIGFKCKISLSDKFNNNHANDVFTLFENGMPLLYEAVSYEDILLNGMGRYSIMDKEILFSASDNSDPLSNKRAYNLIAWTRWKKGLLSLMYSSSLHFRNLIKLHRFVANIPHWNGYAYTVVSPFFENRMNRELSLDYVLFEDNLPLFPADSHDSIIRFGRGQYSVWNNQIIFSTSDNSDPNINGRRYRLVKKSTENNDILNFFSDSSSNNKNFLDILHDAIQLDNQQVAKRTYQHQKGSTFVLFTHALSSGGAERQWCYLAKELDARGHAVTLLTMNSLSGSNGHYLSLLKGTGVTIKSVRSNNFHFNINKFINSSNDQVLSIINWLPELFRRDVLSLFLALVEIKPEYVLCQLDYPNIIGGLGAWIAGVPNILLSMRNVNPSNFPYLHNEWFHDYYSMLLRSRRIFLSGNSQYGNDDYAAWLNINPDLIRLTPNGIDTSAFNNISTDEVRKLWSDLCIGKETAVICSAFRFSEEKQPQLFLDVIARIKNQKPNLKVLLCGEGPLKGDIQKRIIDVKLETTVHLLGTRKDMDVIMAASDIFLLTSRHEGVPNVLLEAQYLKLPVVATKVGGVSEIVQDGKTGYLCSHDSEETLASRCIELLSDAGLRAKLGNEGHRFIKENFSLKKLADSILDALTAKTASQFQNEGVR